MRRLMMTTAIVTATSFGVMAQASDHDETTTEMPAPTNVPAFLASDFTGKSLYTLDSDDVRDWRAEQQQAAGDQPAMGSEHDPQMARWTSSDRFFAERDDWEDVGSISEVVLSQDGMVRGVLIDVGGFLGFMARTVMVDIDELYFVTDDSETEELDDFFVVINMTREELEELPEWDEERLSTGFDHQPMAAAETDAQAEHTEHAMEGAADGDMAMADAEDGSATEEGQIGAPGGIAEAPEDYASVDPAELSADELLGADVYDAMGDNIGNVDDAMLTDDSAIGEVIVDVGGFLGIGSHTVALPLDGAEIFRNDDDDSVRVHLPMNREQVESLPEYEG